LVGHEVTGEVVDVDPVFREFVPGLDCLSRRYLVVGQQSVVPSDVAVDRAHFVLSHLCPEQLPVEQRRQIAEALALRCVGRPVGLQFRAQPVQFVLREEAADLRRRLVVTRSHIRST
jgi:hypothetical protein